MFPPPIWICFLLFQFCTTSAILSPTDTLIPTESITDGQIIMSNGSNFALGFFSPGNSSYKYVGIWYHKVSETTVVWVANRDNPLNDSFGVLSLALDGNLVISTRIDQRRPLWSTNISLSSNTTTVLKLLNSGNMVLYSGRTGNPNRILWQSFDHPTNILLPGMKLGLDRRTGLNRFLTSWKSKDDPGRGIYSFGFDRRGLPQQFTYRGSAPFLRAGPWNGRSFSGIPEMTQRYLFRFDFVNTIDDLYFFYNTSNSSIFAPLVLDHSGAIQRRTWIERNRRWNIFSSLPRTLCDNYGHCGVYGICSTANTEEECVCLPGFEPKSPREWYLNDCSDGCVRQRSLGCGKGDGFLKLVGVKLPDTSMSRVDKNLSLNECKRKCLENCSCTAYAPAVIDGGGSGCVAWFGNLTDIRYFNDGGQDLFLRVDAVELAAQARKYKGILHNKWIVAIFAVSLVIGVLVFAACVNFLLKRRKGKEKKGRKKRHFSNVNYGRSEGAIEKQRGRQRRGFLFDFKTSSTSYKELVDDGTNPELPFIEFDAIATATDYFSSNNKLGEGGFGAVYKGRLLNGKEIAVKRLSKNSGQGMEEFKNEVLLIVKLQHRNLVRLQAYSLHEEEKMLIYEYMPNKSLDSFIFDESKKVLLDWRKRFEIIVGIARGVLYLHQDSRLRIIHRDLKASNVLLDEEMNPKISDFGMARIFGGNQIQANTKKVVGTYGYMSPEYAMQGIFSIKSDVFSFGVLLLEIISGKKNNDYFQDDPFVNLIGHIWDLWKEDRALEIVDSSLGDSFVADEVLRCIQVGLSCVQESASERPTMSTVVFMLGSETNLPPPNQPAFIMRRTLRSPKPSINDVAITMVEPR